MRGPARVLVWTALTAGFTLIILQWSFRYGRLALPPNYDDVAYFADGLERLEVLYRGRLPGLLADYLRNPPHSPFSCYLAMASFALFGVHDWAPYAGNAIIIFTLLAFVDHLLRDQAWWIRLVACVFALTVPFSGEAVADFRPDIACGLLTAMGVVLTLEAPFHTLSLTQRRLAGACFGLALLCKPTIFPMTLVLFAVCLVTALYSDRAISAGPLAAHHVWRSWRSVLWPLALLGLPQFLLRPRYYLRYFDSALLAPGKPIPDFQGTVTERLTFYTLGGGGSTMLGWHLYLLTAIVLLGAALLVGRRRMDSVRPLRNLLVPLAAAYVVPTLNPVKQPFFGVTFAILLFFLAILTIRAVLVAGPGVPRTRWAAAGAAAVALIGILCAKLPPSYWGESSDPAIRQRNRLAQGIYGSIREARPSAKARVYVTTAGSVSAHLLQYMAFKDGYTGWSFGTLGWSDDLSLYKRELTTADFVLASEPGNSEVNPHLPSAALQERTLVLLRDRDDFRERAAFPTLTGKSYFLFERLGPFFGWADMQGFLGEEGPYPQWGLPIVRWGLAPSSRLRARDTEGGLHRLVLDCRSSLGGQALIIRLDGRDVQRHSFGEAGVFERIEIPLELQPGSHVIDLDYSAGPVASGEPKRVVLYRVLQLVPAGRTTRTMRSPSDGPDGVGG